ncbi:MAG: ankyrin repeat domain-containing protein [Deinococcota bacterium]
MTITILIVVGLLSTAHAQTIFQLASSGTPQDLAAVQAPMLNATDAFGQTPLMYAAANNSDPNMINALVDAGAHINSQTSEGWTALMYAARDNSNPDVARRLLQLGADPTLRNHDGHTAADYASANASLQDVPMSAPIEMPMPDPASFANPAAFVRQGMTGLTVPFVVTTYESPFEGISPEFIVPGEFSVSPQGMFFRPPPPMTPAPTTSMMTPSMQAAPAVTPMTTPMNQMMTLPMRPAAVPVMPTAPVHSTPVMTPFGLIDDSISPEFIVPGEFDGSGLGMGSLVPPGGHGPLPSPSFDGASRVLARGYTQTSPIALSNAPVTPGRVAPNIASYAGGSAANITNRSALGPRYVRVPLRYSSSLLPETARPAHRSVRYNPFYPLRSCADFATQPEAQALFEAAGGTFSDRHGLDPDRNGIACDVF